MGYSSRSSTSSVSPRIWRSRLPRRDQGAPPAHGRGLTSFAVCCRGGRPRRRGARDARRPPPAHREWLSQLQVDAPHRALPRAALRVVHRLEQGPSPRGLCLALDVAFATSFHVKSAPCTTSSSSSTRARTRQRCQTPNHAHDRRRVRNTRRRSGAVGAHKGAPGHLQHALPDHQALQRRACDGRRCVVRQVACRLHRDAAQKVHDDAVKEAYIENDFSKTRR